MLHRLALLSMAVVSLTAAPAFAESYADPEGRFSIAVPAGWQAGKPASGPAAAMVVKPDGGQVAGVCVVAVTEIPATKSMSQADIDQQFASIMTKDFWANAYKTQGAQSVEILSTSTREATGGRKVQMVSAKLTIKQANGQMAEVEAREEVHAVPGRMHDVGCLATVDKFEGVKADIGKILASYDPSGGVVASLTATEPSMLTLYAKANFTGVARVVRTTTSTLATVAWPNQTGSVSVAGYGEWQLCEGANFTGACTVLAGAKTAPVNGLLTIGSVRPVTTSPIRGAASVVSTNRTTILNEALRSIGVR